ncbi:MAG: choice-of-anchor J domain-containing protein [Bacteroidales bacterium]|nr:choice-of-anchor J domain-containing protein [Bacteroidales bacterium]
MKKKHLLLAAILMLAVSSAWADTLDVCLPWTHAQRYVPINTVYADWGFENEFIYPASRVNEMAGGTITQITFYAMSDSLDFPETFQLRMEEVADTATQPLAWVRTSAVRHVWTGSVAIRDSLWTITLDTAFPYMGGNLLLSFRGLGQDGGFMTYDNIFCVCSTGYHSVTCRNANAQHVINSWLVNSPQVLPSVTFVYTPGDCRRPMAVVADSVGPHAALLSWDSVSGAMGYEWKLYADGLIVDSGLATATMVTLNSLTTATDYTFRVRTVCDSAATSAYASRTFTTPCDVIRPYDLPFVEDFEDCPTMENFHGIRCWTFLAYSRENWLRVERSSGNNIFSFFPQDNSTPQFAVLPQMQGIPSLTLSFRMRSSNRPGSFEIGVMTDPTDTLTFTPVEVFDTVLTANAWQNVEVSFSYYTGTTGYIAFRAGMPSSVTMSWIEIDDIVVNVTPTCDQMQGIEVANVTSSSADIVIHDTDAVGATYVVTLSGGGAIRTVTQSGSGAISFAGLAPTTDYTASVKKLCADSTAHPPLSVVFRTSCAPMPLPWSESFEDCGLNIPECWKTINLQSNSLSIATAVGYGSGSRSLTCYSSHTPELLVVLPEFSMQPDSLLLGLEVSRYTHGSDSATGVEVGILVDTADASSFVPMATCIPSAFWTWQHYNVTFPGYTSGRIALRFLLVSNVSETAHTFVDNITVEALTDSFVDTCAQPTEIRVTDIHGDRATLHIVSPMAVPHYMVYANGDSVEVFSSVCTLTGLVNDSLYTVAVSSICADSSHTARTEVQFRTDLCAPMPLPWSEDFDTVNTSGSNSVQLTDALPCWKRCGRGTSTVDNEYGTTNYRLKLELGSYNRNNIVVLPDLQGDLSNMEMSFYSIPSYPYNSTDHILQVGYTLTPDDTVSFRPLYSFNAADYVVSYNVVPRTETVSFNGAPADSRIALRIPMGDIAFQWYIDDIEVHAVQQCPRPQAVAARRIGADTAELCITDTIPGQTYRVTLTGGGITQTFTHSNIQTITLTGLIPSTGYVATISTICADSTMSNEVSCEFRTMCMPLTYADMPYSLDFESYPAGDAEEPCWRYYKVLADGSTMVEPYLVQIVENDALLSSAQSGIHALVVASGYVTPTYWVLPAMDSLAYRALEFGYRTAWGAHISFNYRADIGVMTDPLDPATFVLVDSIVSVADTYQTAHVEFYTYTGNSGYIAIRNLSDGGLTIDDLMVSAIAPPPTPSGLELVAVDSLTATVTWQPGGDEELWTVELSCADTLATQTFTQSNIQTFNNLVPLTHYTVRVAAVDKHNRMSEWSQPLEFTTLDTIHTIGTPTAEVGSVAIYPNPAHGSVTIEATSPATVTLLSLNGREVNTQAFTQSSNQTITIDLSAVPRGAYFVKVVSRGSVTVRKLIVK